MATRVKIVKSNINDLESNIDQCIHSMEKSMERECDIKSISISNVIDYSGTYIMAAIVYEYK